MLIALISALMTWGYTSKSTYEFNVLKDRSPPFIRLSDGRIRNGYTLKLVNKSTSVQTVDVSVAGLADAEFEIIGVGTAGDGGALQLSPDAHGVGRYRLLVTAPAEGLAPRTSLRVQIRDVNSGETAEAAAPFTTGDH